MCSKITASALNQPCKLSMTPYFLGVMCLALMFYITGVLDSNLTSNIG